METILKEANRLAASGHLEEAGLFLERKAAEHPDSPELLAHLAYLHYSRGRWSRARETYARYLQWREPDAGICQILADIDVRHREFSSARRWLRQARARGRRRGEKRYRIWSTYLHQFYFNAVRFAQHSFQSSGIRGRVVFSIKRRLTWFAVHLVRGVERCFPRWTCPEKGESDFQLSDFLQFLWHNDSHFVRESLALHKIREVILASRRVPYANPHATLLDIGTGWNPLPVYWATRGARIVVLDGSTYAFPHLKEIEQKAVPVSESNACACLAGDARFLPFASNSFDAVTALCVIEHIPGTGDIEGMREMHRVLRPGGIAVVTVETSPRYEENWLEVPYPIGYQTGQEGPPSPGQTWNEVFCRNYSPEPVKKRLQESAAWRVVDSGFYDDRGFPIRRWLDPARVSPLAFLLRPWQPLLSLLFYRPANAVHLTPSSIGYLVLQKTSNNETSSQTAGMETGIGKI